MRRDSGGGGVPVIWTRKGVRLLYKSFGYLGRKGGIAAHKLIFGTIKPLFGHLATDSHPRYLAGPLDWGFLGKANFPNKLEHMPCASSGFVTPCEPPF